MGGGGGGLWGGGSKVCALKDLNQVRVQYRGANYLAQYKIDLAQDKFRTPTSYQIFLSILRMRCVKKRRKLNWWDQVIPPTPHHFQKPVFDSGCGS